MSVCDLHERYSSWNSPMVALAHNTTLTKIGGAMIIHARTEDIINYGNGL